MEAQHQRVIDRLIAQFAEDPRFPALLIGGSVAKGRARPDSDVDIVLVATEDEYARRVAAGDTLYWSRDLADYPGGYVDGKIISLDFLQDAATRGSEPTRASFAHIIVAYSRLPELATVLAAIPIYPEQDRAEKLAAFYTQVVVSHEYVGEAERRADQYLLRHFADNLILFGGRLILAHNRILYPYHKWFMHELEHAREQPAGWRALIDPLLRTPTAALATQFYTLLQEFQDWGLTEGQAFHRWTEEYEWSWRAGRPALADW